MQSANMEVWSFRKVTRNRASLLIWSAFDSLFLWAVWPAHFAGLISPKLSEHLHLRCAHYMFVCGLLLFLMLTCNKTKKFTLINNDRRNMICNLLLLFFALQFRFECCPMRWCVCLVLGGAKGKPWQSSETWVGVALFSTIPPPHHHL